MGSFAKALADRSLNGKSFGGRSYCPSCKRILQWYDLIPILSYILQRGKCRYCKTKIEIDYLLVELVVGILVGFLFWQSFGRLQVAGDNLQVTSFLLELTFKTFFIVILAAIFLTDLKEMLIPDRIILPAILIGIITKLIITPSFPAFFWSLITGIAIGGFFLSLIIITRGKGMGGGDVRLGLFLGIMLGFPEGVFALILSFLTGALFSVGLIATGKKSFKQAIPFGPFLVLGGLLMLFWGKEIMEWYFRLGN